MQKEFFDKIHFKTRADVEFIFSLIVLSYWTDILKSIKGNYLFTDGDSVGLFSSMYNKIPDEMKKEIKYFFRDTNVAWGIATYLLFFMEDKSVEDLLASLKDQEETTLMSYIVQSYLFRNIVDEQANLDIKNYNTGISAMLAAVRKSKFKKNSAKQKLIDILENHILFKQRLYLLLSAYYYEIYKAEEAKINTHLVNIEEKFRSLFQKDPQHFMNFYLRYEDFKESQEFSIHVSYFAFHFYLFFKLDDMGKTCIILGRQVDKNFLSDKVGKDKLQSLFKILADKTRFDIICALNSRPYFTQELAEKFGMSPSTVNYHLSTMMELDIVTIERENHRVYYTLKKDVFENLLGNSLKIML